MVKVRLLFVHEDGGKPDYGLNFELPEIPRPGDHLMIQRSNSGNPAVTEDFVVIRTKWHLDYHPDNGDDSAYEDAKNPQYGSAKEIMVICKFAVGVYSSESHQKSAGNSAERI